MAGLNSILAYHYTNPKAWDRMNNGDYGFAVEDPLTGRYIEGETIRGLWPIERFLPIGTIEPAESYKCFINALLEPEPRSWKDNPSYSNLWRILMYNVMRCEPTLILLEVTLKPEDKAYVVERALAEKVFRGKTNLSRDEKRQLLTDYWNSRIPIFNYKADSFELPMVIIGTPIPVDRLRVLWEKDRLSIKKVLCQS